MRIANVEIGGGAPLALIAGLNVIEGEALALECAEQVSRIARKHSLPAVFKASFDKANRTRAKGYRGVGMQEGLAILVKVRERTGLPLLTDVHEINQIDAVAGVVDCLQIPAFLCRQTDLLAACAQTDRAINLKKGQFIAPRDMRHAVEKLAFFGSSNVLVTDRGTSFGYNDLVADMRGLVEIREYAPVCFDATHAVQQPGARDGASGGERRFVAPLARAAVATGIDAIFLETHPSPQDAPVDGPCQIHYEDLDRLLAQLVALDRALCEPSPALK